MEQILTEKKIVFFVIYVSSFFFLIHFITKIYKNGILLEGNSKAKSNDYNDIIER